MPLFFVNHALNTVIGEGEVKVYSRLIYKLPIVYNPDLIPYSIGVHDSSTKQPLAFVTNNVL